MPKGPRPRSNAERFWPKVDQSGDCWVWTAARQGNGKYGLFSWRYGVSDYRDIGAHVAAWRLTYGEPNGDVMHHCDNPPCVRPLHLCVGSPAENMADKVRKGRQPRGSAIPWARFTEEDIRGIHVLAHAGRRRTEIALLYATTTAHISDILAGRIWKHLGLTPIPKLPIGRP